MKDRDTLYIPYSRRDRRFGGIWSDLRLVAFLCVAILLLGLAGWLYLRQASEVTHLANAVQEQELHKEKLHRELVILRAEVAMQGSLKRVLQEGIEMGYVLPDASNPTQSLTVPCPGCDTPALGAYRLPEPPALPAEEPTQGLWQSLTNWLGGWLQLGSADAP